MTDAQSVQSSLRKWLISGRHGDGGWGYYPGKAVRLEPTCWALLALRDLDPGVLTSWPTTGGLLRERAAGETNLAFHALAMLTLASRGREHREGSASLLRSLEGAKGLALGPSTINRQDNALQGWSWMAGTFSWVEPTAWALLALRKHEGLGQRVEAARMSAAEALLVDRCCETGGWNYGNSNMLGKELRPYVPTTAIALLALQKRPIPVVTKSVAYLERAAASESSAMAVSLATLALRAHGRPADALRPLLFQAARTIELGQHLGAAMALYALQAETAGDAFAL